MKEFAIVLCLLPAITACVAMGLVFSAAISGISKNPDANGPISGMALLGAAFIESVVLISVVLGFSIMMGIGSPKEESTETSNIEHIDQPS